MFRPHKIVQSHRESHWQMTYIEMINSLPNSQMALFNQALRSQLYRYVPTSHDQKIILALVADFPRLGKLLNNRRKAHGKGKT